MAQKAQAGLGRFGAASVAIQQVLLQFQLQQADLAAERGLGHVQGFGRARKTAPFGHVHEVFDLFEVHAPAVRLTI